jgi:hypothetical protein
MSLPLAFTLNPIDRTILFPSEKPIMPQVNQPRRKNKIMGDKSPKSNQKKSTQKQSKVSSADLKKKQAVASKSAASTKKK